MSLLYPAGPDTVPAGLTAPSARYRRHAWFAVACLAGFILLYLGLMGWFAWTAWRLFVSATHGGLAGGAAFVSLGGAVCAALLALFMAKGLVFRRRGHETSGDIELTREAQPELFDFLHRLADDAGAPRPHRVFLSPRVNASVFYDLSLANLLLPSRKNMEIGLGLVNVLSLGELKAVLAHEFGHFAQRSMAVGRWVYVAQQVATQIVAKRDMLDRFLAGLSRFDLRVAWVGWLLSLVVWSIRSLLEIAFRGVLLAQRALSREMEYQADLVAASLTGSDALVHALHRLGAADEAWERAVQFASGELSQGRSVADLFAVQSSVIEHIRTVLADPAYGEPPPVADAARHRLFRVELAQPPQMWSTHPSNRDREENVKRHYVPCGIDGRPAGVLLRDLPGLRAELSRMAFRGELPPAPPIEESLERLAKEYAVLPMSRRYRGSFLGRSIVRGLESASALRVPVATDEDLAAAIEGLYPPEHGEQIERLRELGQQRDTLEAIRRGNLRTEGGTLSWRGTQLPRRALPRILAELEAELAPLRADVAAHDARARSLHLAAARQLGNGWEALLEGRIALLHYADHAWADLADANGMLGNTWQIVTADGRVSSGELNRLVSACNTLHNALDAIYVKAGEVRLDAGVSEWLGSPDWHSALGEELRLPKATRQNIETWMQSVTGWVGATLGALSSLRQAALCAMLAGEDEVAAMLRGQSPVAEAPAASRVPADFPRLLPGKERRRQHRLGIWDRFMTAEGWFAGGLRLATAAGIVGAVVYAGSLVGNSVITVYNGFDRSVVVRAEGREVRVAAFQSRRLELPVGERYAIEAFTADGGHLIETFTGQGGRGQVERVYNIAAAAPMLEWTATYGSAGEVPERLLGAPHWFATHAAHVFEEPPEQISSKHGGGTRLVLAGLGEVRPERITEWLEGEGEASRVVRLRASWDAPDSPQLYQWLHAAHARGLLDEVMQARLARDPADVMALRAEQDTAGDARADVCARHLARSAAAPGNSGLAYLAVRCNKDEAARDQGFLDGHAQWPSDPWFAMASGYTLAQRQQWGEAARMLEQGMAHRGLADSVAVDLVRIKRQLDDAHPAVLAGLVRRSGMLGMLLSLETGEALDGSALAAYPMLARGQLDQALRLSDGDREVRRRVLRLAGASQGASADLVKRALESGREGHDESTAWMMVALALRERRDATQWRALARELDTEGDAVGRFLDAVRSGTDATRAEAALGDVMPRTRGIAYSAAVVLRGERAPAGWRDSARKLLFGHERPWLG